MKKIIASVLLLAALCVQALAQQGAPTPPGDGGEWGCKVLLCLANPNGPEALSECRPPIERLKQQLSHGGSFPSCQQASNSYARPGYSLYDDCPQGTVAAAPGQAVALAGPMSASPAPASYPSGEASNYTQASTSLGYIGIGDGSAQPMPTIDSGPPPAKVCVAGPRGTKTVYRSINDAQSVALYDTIFVEPAQTRPSYIDVYINNAIWQRVRW